MVATTMLSMSSCVSEDIDLNKKAQDPDKGYIALNVSNDDALTTRAIHSTNATGDQVSLDASDWTVSITGSTPYNGTVSGLASKSFNAAEGYTATVSNYVNLAAALADNTGDSYGKAFYQGTSSSFTVTTAQTITPSIACGKAKNAKFTINASVPTSAAITITATSGSGDNSRALTFTKAANGSFDRTTAYFRAEDEVTIHVVYNSVDLDTSKAKTLTMAGAGTENTLAITTNDNGTISLTITYDDEFTTGNTQTIEFDAGTGKTLSVTNTPEP